MQGCVRGGMQGCVKECEGSTREHEGMQGSMRKCEGSTGGAHCTLIGRRLYYKIDLYLYYYYV